MPPSSLHLHPSISQPLQFNPSRLFFFFSFSKTCPKKESQTHFSPSRTLPGPLFQRLIPIYGLSLSLSLSLSLPLLLDVVRVAPLNNTHNQTSESIHLIGDIGANSIITTVDQQQQKGRSKGEQLISDC